MSWPLTLLVSVICSFSFAATAEAASVRDDFDAISYSGTSIAGSRLAQPFQAVSSSSICSISTTQNVARTDISVRDVLDPAFQYQRGTIQVNNSAASYSGASLSIDAGDQNVAIPQLDINANEVWAVMFSVNMP